MAARVPACSQAIVHPYRMCYYGRDVAQGLDDLVFSRPRASVRTRTILFLIGDTGSGHRSAANAILEAMNRCDAEADSVSDGVERVSARAWHGQIVDVFGECAQLPLRKGVSLYGPAITYVPQLYGEIFRTTNSPDRFGLTLRICQPLLASGLRDLLLRIRPDIIVSIHPLLNHMPLQVLRELDMHPPFVTVVTDLVDVHCGWIAPGVDACIVPTAAARRVALDRDLSKDRVHLLGMPIDPRFACRRGSVRDLRSELGLDPHRRTVLIAGGGEGAGGLGRAVEAMMNTKLDAQVVIVTGKNRRLLQKLRRQEARTDTPIHLRGFVDNMWDYMHAADIIVTKAGPGTISESIACELPIVLLGAVPGQETGNVRYVAENGLGMVVDHPASLPTCVASLLSPAGQATLEHMRAAARRFARPAASTAIARRILGLLPPEDRAPAWDAALFQPMGVRVHVGDRLRVIAAPIRRSRLRRILTHKREKTAAAPVRDLA